MSGAGRNQLPAGTRCLDPRCLPGLEPTIADQLSWGVRLNDAHGSRSESSRQKTDQSHDHACTPNHLLLHSYSLPYARDSCNMQIPYTERRRTWDEASNYIHTQLGPD